MISRTPRSTTCDRRPRRRRTLLVPLVLAVVIFAPLMTTTGSAGAATATIPGLDAGILPVPGGTELPWVGSSPSATITETSLTSGAAPVTLANGQTWDLGVSWGGQSGEAASDLTVALERAVTTGGKGEELHAWEFDLTAPAFTFNTSTGVGVLSTGTQASPVATMDLTFTRTSSVNASCTSGSETTATGTLSGSLQLVTGLAKAGTVGGSTTSFTVGTSTVVTDAECVTPTTEACVAATVWLSSVSAGLTTPPEGEGEAMTGTTPETIVAKEVKLAAPKGATRVDGAVVDSKTPTWNAKTKVLSITSSTTGIVTGSATLTGGKVQTLHATCTLGGKTDKVTLIDNESATYTSAAGSPLTAHTVLTGTLTVASPSTPAFYEIETYKAA